jgi:hypothetical protein
MSVGEFLYGTERYSFLPRLAVGFVFKAEPYHSITPREPHMLSAYRYGTS